jgi:K+-sensing histidine kinase KdpD
VKNVLYNSSAVLMNLYEEHDYDYQCKISVTCIRFEDEAGIVIEDNGPGFNGQALKKLYQAPEKVDINAEVIKGKGSIIVFSYLSIHSGRVELVNKPEGGAKATFLFPLISSIN